MKSRICPRMYFISKTKIYTMNRHFVDYVLFVFQELTDIFIYVIILRKNLFSVSFVKGAILKLYGNIHFEARSEILYIVHSIFEKMLFKDLIRGRMKDKNHN